MTLGEEELFSVDRVSGSVLTLEKKNNPVLDFMWVLLILCMCREIYFCLFTIKTFHTIPVFYFPNRQ